MNKENLRKNLVEEAKISKEQANKAIEVILQSITETLKNDEKITFAGFGTFSVSHRAERKGINPKTGEEITIEARNVPVFKAGKTLKSFLN